MSGISSSRVLAVATCVGCLVLVWLVGLNPAGPAADVPVAQAGTRTYQQAVQASEDDADS
ncbi:MAG: hypothetical protein A2Z04_01950 [Chloroflexi bacterium RBG_16_57_9]|nr:MAG: hypothetical protein A2Z04_01950 [Chloroflexi bacterium RBG_16_57_9]